MALRYDTISFLSDYGRTDEFVGVVHSVIRQLCPEVTVIDVTHDIPPFDVRAGGLALARSVQYLCPGVILAVVDPGVGSDRRGVAVEVADGAAVLVGPDNGLLAPAVAMLGGATRAVWLNDPEHHLESPGPLFDGRDVFAPVAARLCSGEVAFEDLGEAVDPAGLTPGLFPVAEAAEDGLHADVLWVDRYGNVQLNVEPGDLDELGEVFEVRAEDPSDDGRTRPARTARRVDHFAQLDTGAVGLAVDSYGLIALVADRASAAEELSLGPGDHLTLVPIDAADAAPAGATTRVELSSPPGRDRPRD